MSRNSSPRRQFLKTAAGTVVVGGLAGCSGDDGDGGGDGNGNGGDNSGDSTETTTATEAQSNFPQQDVTWLGFDGGFRAYSLAISETMPKHLPNDVNIQVTKPKGWVTGINKIHRAKPDGYTLGLANVPGNVVTQVLQDVSYDLSEFTWIGRVDRSVYGIAVPTDSEFETIEDMQNADKVSFAATGAGTASIVTILGTSTLDINLDFVPGYGGSAEMIAAAVRGDVDAVSLPPSTSTMQTALDNDEIRLLLHYGTEAPEQWPDVTTINEVGDYPNLENLSINRLVGGPPDLPSERQEILTQALLDTMEDDEFQNWAEENNQNPVPGGPEECQQTVDAALTLINENKDVLSKYMG